jgi:hypothetical protein
MARSKVFRAIISCALLGALLHPALARADSFGPARDVHAIRHDLPILLTRELRAHNISAPAVTIDGMAVSGGFAMVQWHAGERSGIAGMELRFGRWWLDQRAPVDWPIDYAGYGCGGLRAPFLVLVPVAQHHLPAIDAMIARQAHAPKGGAMGIPDCPTIVRSWFPAPTMLAAPYEATITFAKTDVDPETDASLEDFNGRAPTQAESWIAPGGNSYFFFSGTVKAEQTVHVQAGTTLDIWFPFVLDPSLTYSLTIGGAGFSPIGPIDGTLADNTLHFVLPAFTAPPGVDMMGEIESN